jgi:hypothetical protein
MKAKLTDFRTGCMFVVLALLLACIEAPDLCAAEENEPLPARIARDLWPCNDLSALAKKYGVSRKLPDTTLVEKQELVLLLSATLERVVEKCGREGSVALPPEDRERLVRLHAALKADLALYEGYRSRREAIEAILAQPEIPDFEYKLGIGGFMRGEGARNFQLQDFSYKPGRNEGRFLYRVKPYAYWHPTDYLDIHAEGQGYGFDGGYGSFHRYSLYQGFVEARLPQTDRISLKIGRQEFSYGSTFMLGSDSFFDGLSFDALRLRAKPLNNVTVDLFGGYYARPFSGGITGNLAGIYTTVVFSEGNALEAYTIYDSGSAVSHADEKRYNFGLRGTAALGPVVLEFEPVYQSGDQFSDTLGRNVSVNAYGGHADTAITIPVGGYNSKLQLGYAYGSGDKASVAGVSAGKEFRNPNNDTSLVGDMSMVGDLSGITVGEAHASGLQIYTLGWGIDLSKELNFSSSAHYVVANEVPNGFSRQIGLETDFSLTYALNGDLSILLGYDHFFTGRFFRDATGKSDDADYGYLMFQFNLSRQKAKGKKS